MIYQSFSIWVITITTLMISMMTAGPAIGGEVADNRPVFAAATRTFEGLLVVKEADGVFLIRSESGQKKRFTNNASTAITRNGKPANYSDLQSRDHILVQYDSNFVVTAIQATGS